MTSPPAGPDDTGELDGRVALVTRSAHPAFRRPRRHQEHRHAAAWPIIVRPKICRSCVAHDPGPVMIAVDVVS